MQIKIEIDIRPDELRRFLGLPDVAALQDDVVHFLREKLEQAEHFDAAAFVKANLKTLGRGNPLSKWLNAGLAPGASVFKPDSRSEEEAHAESGVVAKPAPRRAKKSVPAMKRGVKSTTTATKARKSPKQKGLIP